MDDHFTSTIAFCATNSINIAHKTPQVKTLLTPCRSMWCEECSVWLAKGIITDASHCWESVKNLYVMEVNMKSLNQVRSVLRQWRKRASDRLQAQVDYLLVERDLFGPHANFLYSNSNCWAESLGAWKGPMPSMEALYHLATEALRLPGVNGRPKHSKGWPFSPLRQRSDGDWRILSNLPSEIFEEVLDTAYDMAEERWNTRPDLAIGYCPDPVDYLQLLDIIAKVAKSRGQWTCD
jgi:hypothetical protein